MQENPIKPVVKRFPKLAKDVKTDVLVVGGGITGALCSYFLGKAGYNAITIEMDEVGSGASGASSGILYYGTGTNLVPAIKIWGRKKAQYIWKETAQSIKELIQLAEKNNLDCGLRKPGAVMAAKTIEESVLLEEEQKELGKIGIKHQILSGKEISQFYSGLKFKAGLHLDNCAQIYPAHFAAELAEKTNMELYEYTKLESFESAKDGIIAKTNNCRISCDKIVFAANDFSLGLGVEKHFVPESSVIISSQKINGQQIKKIYPLEKIIWTMEDYYDIIYPHEGRLILEMYRMVDVENKMKYYYPNGFKKESQWGSSWAKTKDLLPIAGDVKENVFVAMAMGDQGTTVGYTVAKQIADMVEGKKNKFLQFTDTKRFGN